MVFVTEQWLLVSLLAIFVVALLVFEARKGGTALTHHEVTRLLNADEAVLVDVRDSKDYKEGHIAGALNMPFAKLTDRKNELEKHRSKTIIIADKLGQHSANAVTTLKAEGFNAQRMQGGMTDWLGQNLPVVKG